VGQWGNTILTVYGCARQGSTVLCDTDLSNQRQGNTEFNSQFWYHTILVDDRGDRHRRAGSYFLNADGEPRQTLDIPYGQSARYVLVFNDVSANAATAKLISTGAELNIENISLNGQQAQPSAANGQTKAQPNAEVQGAVQDTKDKAAAAGNAQVNRARDSVNKALDGLFNRPATKK
jgi:hypothetical protein